MSHRKIVPTYHWKNPMFYFETIPIKYNNRTYCLIFMSFRVQLLFRFLFEKRHHKSKLKTENMKRRATINEKKNELTLKSFGQCYRSSKWDLIIWKCWNKNEKKNTKKNIQRNKYTSFWMKLFTKATNHQKQQLIINLSGIVPPMESNNKTQWRNMLNEKIVSKEQEYIQKITNN